MSLSHSTHHCSQAVKHTSKSKEETDNTLTDKTEQVTSGMKQGLSFCQDIQTINTVFWLFYVSWQIAVAPQFKRHMKRSSFHIYLKHEININEHQKVFYFNWGKTWIQHFSSLSPPKLNYSRNGEFVGMIGHDRLSIKLIANGQFKLYKILPT